MTVFIFSFIQVDLRFGLYLVVDVLDEVYRSIVIFDYLLRDITELFICEYPIGLASTRQLLIIGIVFCESR